MVSKNNHGNPLRGWLQKNTIIPPVVATLQPGATKREALRASWTASVATGGAKKTMAELLQRR